MSSMSDMVKGLYPKPRHERSPDFVIGKLSINVAQFQQWMKEYLAQNPNEEWINIEMKLSKNHKGFAVLDKWKPEARREPAASQPPLDDHIPF